MNDLKDQHQDAVDVSNSDISDNEVGQEEDSVYHYQETELSEGDSITETVENYDLEVPEDGYVDNYEVITETGEVCVEHYVVEPTQNVQEIACEAGEVPADGYYESNDASSESYEAAVSDDHYIDQYEVVTDDGETYIDHYEAPQNPEEIYVDQSYYNEAENYYTEDDTTYMYEHPVYIDENPIYIDDQPTYIDDQPTYMYETPVVIEDAYDNSYYTGEEAPVIGNTGGIMGRQLRVTVSFNGNGGSVNPISRMLLPGSQLGSLPMPTRPNHSFVGWFTTPAATGGAKAFTNSIIRANATLWARWRANATTAAQQATIFFNANGGSVNPTSRNINAGNSIGNLPTPSRAGFTFLGWFNTSAASGGTQIFASTIIRATGTIWARWRANATAQITIFFNANGGSVNPTSRNINTGTPVGALPMPSRAGFAFVGWFNTAAASGGTQIFANTVIHGNGTMWARWQQQVVANPVVNITSPANNSVLNRNNIGVHWTFVSGATYAISLRNLNTNQLLISNQLVTGTSFTIGQHLLTAGHRFRVSVSAIVAGRVGWSERDFNIQAQAVFRNITFNGNGGTPTTTTLQRQQGTQIGGLPNVTRAGFTFAGWWTAQTGGAQVFSNTMVPANNVTYWARWNTQLITVSFNANGGTVSPTARSINVGSQIGNLPTPTRAGFAFVGWFNTSAASDGTQILANRTFNATATIWARWQQQTVPTRTVTFNSNGGTAPNPRTINVRQGFTINTAISQLPNVSRNGFDFLNWRMPAVGGVGFALVGLNTPVHHNITATANWQFTITFRGEGTQNLAPIDFPFEQTVTTDELPQPTRSGHRFLGWSQSQNGAIIPKEEPLRGNMTLWARWVSAFRWPVRYGRPAVSQGFNPSHGAIDIPNENNIAGFTSWTPLPVSQDTPVGRNAELTGNTVVAAGSGVVATRISLNSSAGNGFVIAHGGGYFTRYLHLHRESFANFNPGAPVSQGQVLGLTGQTGQVRSDGHLHFEIIFVEGREGFSASQDAALFRGAFFTGARTGTQANHTFWKHNPSHYLPQLINRTVIPAYRHHWELRN